MDIVTPVQKARFKGLDSLRGIAALTVVLSHYALLEPFLNARRTPLRLILGGHEAVVMFFVLSGLVLSFQINSVSYKYSSYFLKRICRIYLPYLAALLLGLLLRASVKHTPVTWAGDWMNNLWAQPLSAADIVKNFVFIGPFATFKVNGVIWTLVYELRISLMLPALILLSKRIGILQTLFITAIGSLGLGVYAQTHNYDLQIESVYAQWLPMFHYVFMFMCGITIGAYRVALIQLLEKRIAQVSVLALGLFLYSAPRAITMHMHSQISLFLYDWLVLLGASLIVIFVSSENQISRWIEAKPLINLGASSYSLYLFHLIILSFIIGLLRNVIPPILQAIIALLVTSLITYLSFKYIELPSIRLGSYLARLRKPKV